MSKKKEKRSALEKELERRMRTYKNPFFNSEPIEKYCDAIKGEACNNGENFAFMAFNESKQYLPSGVHLLTGEAVVMVNRMYADPFWIQFSAGEISNAEAFIGEVDDPVTGLPKIRAFWRCELEETGEDHLIELESFYAVALANYNFETHNSEGCNTAVNYALITGFINNTMFEMDFYETPSIRIIKEFISNISAALKSNPEKRIINMTKKEAFMALISKLTPEISKSLAVDNEDDNTIVEGKMSRAHYRKFEKQFKIATVKRVKENRLPVSQVADELGIHSSAVFHWIREYDTKGEENAFRGRGRVSHNMEDTIDKLFQDVADDKEKMLVAPAYKERSFDKDFKISTVKRIKENNLPVMQVAEKLGIDVTTINRWRRAYEEHGEDGFPGRNTPNRKKYDRQLKMVAVKLVKENNQPISEVEKNLGIGSGNVIQWIAQYEKYGENAFQGRGVYRDPISQT